ncbi:ovostatin homolog isoform X2 [Rana temporaria]|uniref:ovostatin homolog isoform X2 n=1 Tax=Rana temporaria TaxID=8407 RepID=UPI001AAE0300|nr:ovostatin homolog isoform X2 [Rana temporaria]
MGSRGLLLSVTFLSLIAGGISDTEPPPPKCDYTMIASFRMASGSQSKVCTRMKSEKPVTITVVLEYFSEILTILIKPDTSNHYECTEFTVPEVDEETQAFISFAATGDEVNVADRRAVVIVVPQSACMFQKSQPIYNQGEEIQVKMVCYDENMNQVVRNFTTVTLVDPNGAHVCQILNPSIIHGVVHVVFELSPLAELGFWQITFEDDKKATEYVSVQVNRFDLPRVDWKAKCPDTISVLDEKIDISGVAEYTYGDPVPGTAVVRCCRTVPKYGREANCFRGIDDICDEFTTELDEDGKFSGWMDLAKFNLPFSGLSNYMTCDITMKEDGTGDVYPSSCYMQITNRLAVIRLDRTFIGSSYNKVHLPVAATLTDEKGNPLPFARIKVQIDGADVKCLTTDADGRAETEIDTSSYNNPNITLSVSYEDDDLCYGRNEYDNYYINYPNDKMVLFRSYSKSRSHIRIRPLQGQLSCDKSYSMNVDYSFTEEGVGKGATTINILYIFMSRHNIAAHGEVPIDLSESYKGSVTIEFTVDSTFATGATCMAYAHMTEDIITDTASLNVDACFKNKVNLEFTEEIVAPGATVHQKITAAPGSFCGLRGTDASFTLLNLYDEFNANHVYNKVQSYIYGLNHNDIHYEDPKPPCIDGNKEDFHNGMYCRPSSCRTDEEAYQAFKDLNLQMGSSLDTRRPVVCGMENEPDFSSSFSGVVFAAEGRPFADGEPRATSIDTIRTDFSESFGYTSIIIGEGGEEIVSAVISQSITSWESDAFCISANEGLGLTTVPATTTTKQDFFVQCSMSTYAIRGEALTASIGVSNNMDKCAHVEVSFDESENFEVASVDNKGQQCVCGKQKSFWTISISFKIIGIFELGITAKTTKISDTCDGDNDDTQPSHSDKIVLIITSEAEGIRRRESSSHFLSVSDSTNEAEISVVEPDDLVPESFELTVHIMGEPVALMAGNYNNLLSTPSGCCDQMQGSLQALIFLKEHLENLGELTDDESKKMEDKLLKGYMDMIRCQQYDGSFSRYPGTSGTSTWGTILGLRTLIHLSKHIYIDENIPKKNFAYLGKIQDSKSGCLNPEWYWSTNQVNNNATIAYNAMAASILWEMSDTFSAAAPILDGVQRCLDNADFSSQDTSTQAHMLNAAASAGNWDQWQDMYDFLETTSISDGGTQFWVYEADVTLVLSQFLQKQSTGNIPITATILISMTKHPSPSQELLNAMGRISKWLAGRITGSGGFYAAQSTSLAIEAMTRFSQMTNTKETDVVVSVLQNEVEVFKVQINNKNRFLVQSTNIPVPFAEYTVAVTGTGSAFVQFTTTYYIQIPKEEHSAFDVAAQATAMNCFGGVAKKVDVTITIRYKGDRVESGDVIVTVSLMTGYQPDLSSIKRFENIADYRMDGNKVLFYLYSVSGTETKFTMTTYLQNKASTLMAASVVVEALETGEVGGARYTHPCASEPEIEQAE